jgi:hypothetical protein
VYNLHFYDVCKISIRDVIKSTESHTPNKHSVLRIEVCNPHAGVNWYVNSGNITIILGEYGHPRQRIWRGYRRSVKVDTDSGRKSALSVTDLTAPKPAVSIISVYISLYYES